jgi:multiple sugar transport system ATP-binding protein
VLLDGRDVSGTAARDRSVALVFQDFALYPHMTVAENIGFPLLHASEAAREARIAELVAMLDLADVVHRRPPQLSGGQRQRVAMARAIARPPQAFLLDQPLSSLDTSARDAVRSGVLSLVHELGVATVYVTHDQIEALSVADRVAVMRKGRIEQIGTPEEIYSDPRRRFVAAFVGIPRMNLLQAAVYAQPEVRTVIDLGTQTLELPWSDPRARILAGHHTERITVGIRPDALTVAAGAERGLSGTVRMVELRGHDVLVHLETGCSPTPYHISQLEFPDATGSLTHAIADPLQRGRSVRDRLLRLAPQQRPADEPVRYAVQPAYDPEADHARHALGDLMVIIPAAEAPPRGSALTVAVDLNDLYLFDGAGDRIRLSGAPVQLPDPTAEGYLASEERGAP